jgi:hypothetical protein
MAGPLTRHYGAVVRERVAAWPETPDLGDLNELLRALARWRSKVIANTFISRHGARVLGGPFAGMAYVSEASEGALVPRLLGTYEDELHPYLRAFAAEGLDTVIDVGCAEGYYAVGLARLMPEVTVQAYDIDEKARRACAGLAEQNGVAPRVIIGGEFAPDGFEAFAGRRVLVMVDARPLPQGRARDPDATLCAHPRHGPRRPAAQGLRDAGLAGRTAAPRPASGGLGMARPADALAGDDPQGPLSAD